MTTELILRSVPDWRQSLHAGCSSAGARARCLRLCTGDFPTRARTPLPGGFEELAEPWGTSRRSLSLLSSLFRQPTYTPISPQVHHRTHVVRRQARERHLRLRSDILRRSIQLDRRVLALRHKLVQVNRSGHRSGGAIRRLGRLALGLCCFRGHFDQMSGAENEGIVVRLKGDVSDDPVPKRRVSAFEFPAPSLLSSIIRLSPSHI